MNDFTKTNLFYCPIYKIRIDPNSYDKEKILNEGYLVDTLNNLVLPPKNEAQFIAENRPYVKAEQTAPVLTSGAYILWNQ